MIEDIFRSSTRVMSATPVGGVDAPAAWDALLSNRILVVLAVAFVLMNIPNLFRLSYTLVDCLSRYRSNLVLEHSLNLSHMRDLCALSAVLPLCLMADRFKLISPAFFSLADPFWHALMVIGIVFVYLLLRYSLFTFFRPYKLPSEVSVAVRHVLYTYSVIMVAVMLVTVAIMLNINPSEADIRKALIWEAALMYFMVLLREFQIYTGFVHGFITILYLCAFEIVPASVLVACITYL